MLLRYSRPMMCFGTILLGLPSGFYLLPMQDIWIVYGASDLNCWKIQKILKPLIKQKREKYFILRFSFSNQKNIFSNVKGISDNSTHIFCRKHRMRWLRPSWAQQIADGDYHVHVGHALAAAQAPHRDASRARGPQWFCKGWSLESISVQRKMKERF